MTTVPLNNTSRVFTAINVSNNDYVLFGDESTVKRVDLSQFVSSVCGASKIHTGFNVFLVFFLFMV